MKPEIYPKMSDTSLATLGYKYTGEYRQIKPGEFYLGFTGHGVYIATKEKLNPDKNRWIVVPLEPEYIKLPDLRHHEIDSDFPDLGETRNCGNLKNKGLFLYSNSDVIFSVEIDDRGCQVLVAKRAKK